VFVCVCVCVCVAMRDAMRQGVAHTGTARSSTARTCKSAAQITTYLSTRILLALRNVAHGSRGKKERKNNCRTPTS